MAPQSLQAELREKVQAAKAASEKPPVKEYKEKDHPDDKGKLKPGPGRESFKLASFWYSEVLAYEQYNTRWFQRGNTVLKRYRDERSKLETQGIRRMNLLWATTKIMKPAIYSRCPDPIVDRKFLDKDPTGRLSSVILERNIRAQLEHGYHQAMNRAVYDRLLPGRGQIWVRYEPEFAEGDGNDKAVSIPAQQNTSLEDSIVKIAKDVGDTELIEETNADEQLEETGDILAAEKIVCDYIDWRDFYLFPAKARTWDEVQAVGKKVFMSKAECIERFGETIGRDLRPDTTPESSKQQNSSSQATDTTIFRDVTDRSIVVWEIWNKSDRRVYWISQGYDYLCDVREDPYKLKKFFPCPEPLSATTTNDTMTPVPDYYEYQDQAIQIDELTQRIAMLTRACKVAGAYNAANKALSRILEETTENQLIPVDQWAMFADQGGVKGAMDFLPLDQIQSCIDTLQKVRQSAMQDLDQITGISDIVRGTSDSRETLGGIRLKNNNAGTRLSESQTDVQRFARDVIELIGELAAKHFSDDTLIEASGILYDEECDPETVMREFEPQMPGFNMKKPYQMGNPLAGDNDPSKGQPMQPQMGGGIGGDAGANPAADGNTAGKTPSPNAVPPVTQNNVVPFPQVGNPNVIESQMATPVPSPDVLILEKIGKAIELLRNDVPRGYRISIETDSTIFGDKVQERQDASDFVEAIGGFMANFERLGQEVPEAMPLLARTLQWAVRKFRIGRDLESEINSFVSRMEKKAKLLIENPQPSIEERKLKADQENKQMDLQAKKELAQMEGQRQEQDDMRQFQLQQANDERDAQRQAAEDQRTAQLEELKLQLERERFDMERQKMAMEMEMAKMEHDIKMRELQAKVHIDGQKMQMDVQKQHMDMQQSHEEHAMNMQQAHEQHEMQKEQTTDQHKMAKESHKQGMEANKQKAELGAQQHKQKMQAAKQKPDNKGKK